MALKRIWVKGAQDEPGEDGGFRMGLWERDPEHPGGEVTVVGPKAVLIAETPYALAKLSEGAIVRTSEPDEASADERDDGRVVQDAETAGKGESTRVDGDGPDATAEGDAPSRPARAPATPRHA